MNAASKLAAMAKVLETPIKTKSGKNCSLKTDCPPGKPAGVCQNPSTLTELPVFRPEERSPREKTSDSEQKQTVAARTKPLSHLHISVPEKQESPVDAELKPQTAAHAHLCSHKPSQHMASPSQVDVVNVSVRTKTRELHPRGVDSSKAGSRLTSERHNKPVHMQEAPVRDEKRPDWSTTSSDSETDYQLSRLSFSGRKVEPVKPFSVSAASARDFGEFGGFTPDVSDMTVYNEIPKRTPHTQTSHHVKMSSHREPTPGSEADGQHGVCPRPLFSELRQSQQDSGFDSPFYQQK